MYKYIDIIQSVMMSLYALLCALMIIKAHIKM